MSNTEGIIQQFDYVILTNYYTILSFFLQEVELHEAAIYGVMERVPRLLQFVCVNAVNMVSWRV